ncbi:hypothetical protein EK21DRAFT_92368 [Setomelanomma holmii]|uniref:Uncharacterized protein n=1 Tax=Setomelanomma holmii TaxID=210430 RepID=A0A9P4H310_9PLEO|nr:hypothetical protein EK21DRAFT_92368 [Setomelanomma holmii]
MLPQHVLLALVATVAAVPLNINLGAYSPALVVGDGEIAIGEAKSASELMATLASGNAQAAANGNAQQGQQEQGQQAKGQAQEQPTEGEAAKRAPNMLRRAISDFISKRVPAPAPAPATDDKLAAVEAATEWIKRDLQGFQAALNYAREALKDQPKVELGSPNAGIGILVNPGVNVPKDSAAAGVPAAKAAKRSEVSEETESPKMTLVAITEV